MFFVFSLWEELTLPPRLINQKELLGLIGWNVLVFLLPYCFVQFHFFDAILFRDSNVAAASTATQRLFAITVALCFHSHAVLLAYVMEWMPWSANASRIILFSDVALLVLLVYVVFPAGIFYQMTRTTVHRRLTFTLVSLIVFWTGMWRLGLFFPSVSGEDNTPSRAYSSPINNSKCVYV